MACPPAVLGQVSQSFFCVKQRCATHYTLSQGYDDAGNRGSMASYCIAFVDVSNTKLRALRAAL